MSDSLSDERHPGQRERQPVETNLGQPESRGQSRWGRRTTLLVVVSFWLAWYVAFAIYAALNAPTFKPPYMLQRLAAAVVGALLSFVIAAVISRMRQQRLAVRAAAALVLALLGTAFHTYLSLLIWQVTVGTDDMKSPLWIYYASDFVIRFWWFACVSASILAVSYVADIRDREERIVALQALAHSAKLRALRNQLNPHFLFNALNSMASLLSRDRSRDAEAMTENLADFLRETLSLDPQKLIPLREEVRLQQLYLEIEKVRFPERLHVSVSIPESLQGALVPSLITQPLIENSIKYGVARSTEPVLIEIRADATSETMFCLEIEDSGGNSESTPIKSANLGLSNVSERVRAHYGDSASVEFGPSQSGGFRTRIRLPLRNSR